MKTKRGDPFLFFSSCCALGLAAAFAKRRTTALSIGNAALAITSLLHHGFKIRWITFVDRILVRCIAVWMGMRGLLTTTGPCLFVHVNCLMGIGLIAVAWKRSAHNKYLHRALHVVWHAATLNLLLGN